MKNLLLLFVAILPFLSCKKGNEPNEPLQSQLDAGIDPLLLLDDFPLDSFYGKSYQGGLIFHMMSNGTGMVAATEDLSESATWGCGGQTIDGADEKLIGYGKSNSDSITSQCLDIYSAAWLCENSNLNGFSDWYLPNLEELRKMRNKLYTANFGNLSPYYYWCSTEGDEFNSAYYVLFDDGTYLKGSKSLTHFVRAIRNF